MKKAIINTLKDLLSYKTYKDNTSEIEGLFDYINNNYNDLFIKKYKFNDREAMVLSNVDDNNLDIIFCTHIDVVYADNYDFKEDNDNIYGRGTIDMKGSVAVCLTLLKNIKTNLKVALFITSDEEIDGFCAEELSKLYKAKFCIVPDGGSNFQLIVEEKGLIQLELSTHTKSCHAAELYKGENAILKLFNVYNRIIEKYPIPSSNNDFITSVNLSKLEGGTSNNQVPGFAKMVLDIRNVDSDIQSDIIDFINNIDKDVNVKVITQGSSFKCDLDSCYTKKYIESSEKVLAKKVKKVKCTSTSDAIFFSNNNIPTIIMNPIGGFAHSDKEYVNKESLYTLYNIYKEFIKDLENE